MTNMKKANPFKMFIGFLTVGKARREVLEKYNWYRNMTGGWTHPHAMDYMSAKEIMGLTPKQLEYKLKYGSMASLPEALKTT